MRTENEYLIYLHKSGKHPQSSNKKFEVDWMTRKTGCHRPGIRTGKTNRRGKKQ